MPKRNLAWILVVVVIALLLWQFPMVIAERDAVLRSFGPINEVRTDILRYSVQTDDKMSQRMTDAAVKAACDAMIAGLHDPHARYFDPAEAALFEQRAEGLIGGIGADVAVVDGRVIVQTVATETPAQGAGLQRGDQIVTIEGQPVERIGLLESVHLLAGEPGSDVRFGIRRGAEPPRQLTLTRTFLQINPVRGWSRSADGNWRWMIDRAAGIAYVRLTEYLPNAPFELDRAMEQLLRSGVRGLILDLRENRGGRFEAAIEVADRFLESGVIVSTRGRASARQEWSARPEGTYPELPLVILVNEWTASSAEIVAGALRDHRRAEIVGERTYGKGSVQKLFPLVGSAGSVKLTTDYYYLPSGVCIQKSTDPAQAAHGWGVEPTVPVPLTPPQREAWLNTWLTAVWTQPAASGAATAPATGVSEIESERTELEAMTTQDIQFARALSILRDHLSPATSTAPAQ